MALSFLRTICAAFVLVLALPAATATAQTIYRSVDAHGNVTYSNQPPPANAVNVEEVSVQPGPSDAAQREARERCSAMRRKQMRCGRHASIVSSSNRRHNRPHQYHQHR
jgi:hypothetical protein